MFVGVESWEGGDGIAAPGAAPRPNAAETAAGSWLWTPDSGEMIWSSDVFRLLGLKAGEVVPSSGEFLARVHADDKEALASAGAALRRGEAVDLEIRVIWPDGAIRRVRSRAEAVPGQAGGPLRVIGVLSDLDGARAGEAALREGEERLRFALQAGRMYAWERDLSSDEVTRTGNAEDVVGFTAGGITSFLDHVHPDDRSLVEDAIGPAIREGAPYSIEFRFTKPDGRTVWLADIGRRVTGSDRERFVGLTFDVTERKELQASLQESEARFRDVAEASSDWIWETDEELRLSYVSGRFSDMTGASPESVLGRRYTDFLQPGDAALSWERHLIDLAARRSFRDVHARLQDAAGEARICRLSGRPVLDPRGRFQGYRGTASDVTAEIEARAQAEHLALHDALTGLPNRLLLRERLDRALQLAEMRRGITAVVCLDLDRFKEVNDTLGHAAGDLLLRQVADFLVSITRESDTVARLGGDEFVLVLTDLRRVSQIETLARKLSERAARPFAIDGHDVYIGFSAGAAVTPRDGRDGETLLRHADVALYDAKARGRGMLRHFVHGMDTALQSRKKLEQDLRLAGPRGELDLHYQPLVDVVGKRMVGAEALMRWRHPERGAISPVEFIPIAEQSGLIVQLGEWALRTACAEALGWGDLRLSVNVSAVQFRHLDFVPMVSRILAETGFPPARLELEITESVLLQDMTSALATLTTLKALGVSFAMDDFGTGYSSLSYLNKFAFDKIKIDRSFIRDLGESPECAAIIRAALSLGRNLGLETNAEGVETDAQFEFLRSEGCDQVQGYLFSPPVPAHEFAALLSGAPPPGSLGQVA